MEDIKIRSLRNKQKEMTQQTVIQQEPEIKEEITVSRKKNPLKKIVKILFFCLFVFLLGGLGGVWLDRIFLPTLLVKYPLLNQYELLKRVNERTTVVYETRDIKISQEEAASSAIEKTKPTIAEIMAKNETGSYVKIGTGIILTSDGYLITPLKNIYSGEALNQDIQVKLANGKSYTAGIAAQNPNYGLAILKISESNLSVIPYANSEELKLGEKIIVVDDAIVTDIISKFIDNYVMPGSTDSSFQKRIQIVQNLGDAYIGSAVINLEGRLVGVEQGANIVIPISEVREFINQSVGA